MTTITMALLISEDSFKLGKRGICRAPVHLVASLLADFTDTAFVQLTSVTANNVPQGVVFLASNVPQGAVLLAPTKS